MKALSSRCLTPSRLPQEFWGFAVICAAQSLLCSSLQRNRQTEVTSTWPFCNCQDLGSQGRQASRAKIDYWKSFLLGWPPGSTLIHPLLIGWQFSGSFGLSSRYACPCTSWWDARAKLLKRHVSRIFEGWSSCWSGCTRSRVETSQTPAASQKDQRWDKARGLHRIELKLCSLQGRGSGNLATHHSDKWTSPSSQQSCGPISYTREPLDTPMLCTRGPWVTQRLIQKLTGLSSWGWAWWRWCVKQSSTLPFMRVEEVMWLWAIKPKSGRK